GGESRTHRQRRPRRHRKRTGESMSTVKAVGILGIGRALPPNIRRNEDWPAEYGKGRLSREKKGEADPYRGITGGSASEQHYDPIISKQMARWAHDPFRGTKERRVIGADEKPSTYEIAAAREALEHAKVDPKDVDLLLVHSMESPVELLVPFSDAYLPHQLVLNPDAGAW